MSQYTCLRTKNNILVGLEDGLLEKFYNEFIEKEIVKIKTNYKYDFKCSNCNENYKSNIKDWVRKKHEPGHCKHYNGIYVRKAKVKISFGERYPGLIHQWSKNNGFSVYDVGYCSNKKCLWICDDCSSEYEQAVSDRGEGSGCPFCAGKKINETNSLFHIKPEIAKNIISPDPKTLRFNSGKKCLVKCSTCNEIFTSTPRILCISYSRGNTGCSFCLNKIVNHNNNLLNRYPDLCEDWDYDKNELGPENYTYGKTRQKFWWKCKDCFHSWEAQICVRVGFINKNGTLCPHCTKKISKREKEWLDYLKIPEQNRQINIKVGEKRFKVDALVDNTIYEFNGDFWHGNLQVYNKDNINVISKKTFGELNESTLNKANVLKSAGYEVISIWESDWLKLKKENN